MKRHPFGISIRLKGCIFFFFSKISIPSTKNWKSRAKTRVKKSKANKQNKYSSASGEFIPGALSFPVGPSDTPLSGTSNKFWVFSKVLFVMPAFLCNSVNRIASAFKWRTTNTFLGLHSTTKWGTLSA
jgi:hypothetical protein